jgi:thymidine kinase
MPQLMACAEYVSKVHAVCVDCGNLAHFSHRTVAQKEQVLVGAVEKYKPLCRSCYQQNNP